VRSAFFGEQAQRVQRERDDIRVMVRMPLAQRQSLSTLDHLRIRTPSGGEAPFHSVATATFSRARSDIQRIDGAQVVSISAKPEDETVDVVSIAKNLTSRLDAVLNTHPELPGDTPDTWPSMSKPESARSSVASLCFSHSMPCWRFRSVRSINRFS
jgi:multidrug efflux pump subunit AcrB